MKSLYQMLTLPTSKVIEVVDSYASPVGVQIVVDPYGSFAVWGRFRNVSQIPEQLFSKDLKTAYAKFYQYANK